MNKIIPLFASLMLLLAVAPVGQAQTEDVRAAADDACASIPPEGGIVIDLLCGASGAIAAVLDIVDGLLGGGDDCETEFAGTHTDWSFVNDVEDEHVAHHAFCASEGDEVYYIGDNVDTPSDVWACISSTATESCMFGNDDAWDCTNTHFFGCPEGTGTLGPDADGDGMYYIHVGTWSSGENGYTASVSVS